mgnify:CR=1 FL=1
MLSTISTMDEAHTPTQNIEHEERHVKAEGAPAQRLKTGGWDMIHSFQSSIPHTPAQHAHIRQRSIHRSIACSGTNMAE